MLTQRQNQMQNWMLTKNRCVNSPWYCTMLNKYNILHFVQPCAWKLWKELTVLILSIIFFFFFFYNCTAPLRFLPWKIWVTFPWESLLQESGATQPLMHAGCFCVSIIYCMNSDMNCRIFTMRTWSFLMHINIEPQFTVSSGPSDFCGV